MGHPASTPGRIRSGREDTIVRYISFKPWKRGAAALEHTWQRPSWRCRACGQQWPCAPARASLTDGADRVSLAMYMWGNLDQAVNDLPRRSPEELFHQFVGWTHAQETGTTCSRTQAGSGLT
jgi:hypothetical protein